jgi:hypothetical protein
MVVGGLKFDIMRDLEDPVQFAKSIGVRYPLAVTADDLTILGITEAAFPGWGLVYGSRAATRLDVAAAFTRFLYALAF